MQFRHHPYQDSGRESYSFLPGVDWPLTRISGFLQARGCRCLPLVRTPLQSPDWLTPNTYRVHIPLPSLPHLRGFTCTGLVTPTGMRGGHAGSKGQCRLSAILAGNDLILKDRVQIRGIRLLRESHTGGGTELILQSTGSQLPGHGCLSA